MASAHQREATGASSNCCRLCLPQPVSRCRRHQRRPTAICSIIIINVWWITCWLSEAKATCHQSAAHLTECSTNSNYYSKSENNKKRLQGCCCCLCSGGEHLTEPKIKIFRLFLVEVCINIWAMLRYAAGRDSDIPAFPGLVSWSVGRSVIFAWKIFAR